MKLIIPCLLTLMSVQLAAGQVTWTLNDFLNRIEESNHDLQLAEQDLQMADVYKAEARSTALPKLMLEGSYTRNLDKMYMYVPGFFFGDSSGASVGMPINYKNDYNYSVVLNQSLFDANVFYANRAARELEHVTENIYKLSRRMVYIYARKAFYQTLLAEKVYQIALEAQQSAEENFLNMKAKFNEGVVSELAMLQAEVRWQNAAPELKLAQRNHELALNYLKKMAGYDLDADVRIEGSFSEYPELPPDISMDQVLDDRPDYQALQWEGRLRTTNVHSKYAGYLPQLSGNAIYAFSGASDDFKVENDNSVYMLGLKLSWPIWLGGYQEAQVRKARVDVRKNQIKQQQMEADIAIEIRNIQLRLVESRGRIQAADQLLATAGKAFSIAQNTSENGLITQLELKDARIGFDQAQLNYYAAVYDYLAAHLDWQLATGQ